jgi:hypothetical protein
MHRPKRPRLTPSQCNRCRPETSFCDLDVKSTTGLHKPKIYPVISR